MSSARCVSRCATPGPAFHPSFGRGSSIRTFVPPLRRRPVSVSVWPRSGGWCSATEAPWVFTRATTSEVPSGSSFRRRPRSITIDRSAMPDRDRTPGGHRSLHYLRRRSFHRLWWRSPSVALKALCRKEPTVRRRVATPASVSEPWAPLRPRPRHFSVLTGFGRLRRRRGRPPFSFAPAFSRPSSTLRIGRSRSRASAARRRCSGSGTRRQTYAPCLCREPQCISSRSTAAGPPNAGSFSAAGPRR